MDIGIPREQRQKMAQGLAKILADTYVLYLKTQNYHWNVKGPYFVPLHNLFNSMQEELAHAIDTIAERIRSLGQEAPGSFAKFLELTKLSEEHYHPTALDMVRHLTHDHEHMLRHCQEIKGIAEEINDEVTHGLLIERMQYHAKAAWILRSHLDI